MTVTLDVDRPVIRRRIYIKEVKRCVCMYYKITDGQLSGHSRKWRYSHPRQVAMTICREFLKLSYPQIAHHFGLCDHTTVIAGQRAVARRCAADSEYKTQVDRLRGVFVLLAQANEAANDSAPIVIPVDSSNDNPDIIPNGVETCSQF